MLILKKFALKNECIDNDFLSFKFRKEKSEKESISLIVF